MTENSPKQKSSRLTRGLLIGSLTLNFLIIGGAIGIVATADKHRHQPTGSFSTDLFTRALDDARRDNVRANLKENMDTRRQADRQKNRAAFDSLLATMAQEPFARDAVVSALNALEAQGAARRMEGTNALLDVLEDMTVEERTDYVERLKRDLRKKRSGKNNSPKKE